MKSNSRRGFLGRLGLAISAAVVSPLEQAAQGIRKTVQTMNPILEVKPMGFQWETLDPFLFCVHHEDDFPRGNDQMGPAASLTGRSLGDDFIIKDGFRMYHGKQVPGFPGHPHRGFETITVVRKGLVDHADSMGAAGRYGNGDVQWMTAGGGVQHSEMFPLLNKDKGNPLELFQIWLNLPAKSKMVKPHFKMFWAEQIPQVVNTDAQGRKTRVEVIAGKLGKSKALQPPPDSWAADPLHEVAVWNILMDEQADFTLPAAGKEINRMLYFYEGEQLLIDGNPVSSYKSVRVLGSASLKLKAAKGKAQILVLQGKPINEQVIQYGPFVMNTKEEIKAAFDDYHRTGFGGWPWKKADQVHDRSLGRFAKHADGKQEKPGV